MFVQIYQRVITHVRCYLKSGETTINHLLKLFFRSHIWLYYTHINRLKSSNNKSEFFITWIRLDRIWRVFFCSRKLINPVQPPWFVWTRVADSLEVVTGIVRVKGEGRWCLVVRGRQTGPLTLYNPTNWQGRVMSCCRLLVDPRPIPGLLCQ